MKKMVNKKTGDELKAKRVAKGLTHEQLAHRARVSVSCVSLAERSGILYDTVPGRRLARQLGVPVASLAPLRRVRPAKAFSVGSAVVVGPGAVVQPVDCGLGQPNGATSLP